MSKEKLDNKKLDETNEKKVSGGAFTINEALGLYLLTDAERNEMMRPLPNGATPYIIKEIEGIDLSFYYNPEGYKAYQIRYNDRTQGAIGGRSVTAKLSLRDAKFLNNN